MIVIKILTLITTFMSFISLLIFAYVTVVCNHSDDQKNTVALGMYMVAQQILTLATIATLYFSI